MVCMKDNLGREINYLRLAVTDCCNLRCRYCMPEHGVTPFTGGELLTKEELLRVCRCMVDMGISRIRITGGEPLIRKDIAELTGRLRQLADIEELAMTSNGVLLKELAAPLRAAGLDSVNVSMDSLERNRYREITRRDALSEVLCGIAAAKEAGLIVKINCTAEESFPIAELYRFADFSSEWNIPVRFIEMMPIGEGRRCARPDNDRLLAALRERYPQMELRQASPGSGPAVYYQLGRERGCIGFISAVHHRFCCGCNRLRLTADGFLKLCLAREDGVSLRDAMRAGVDDKELMALISENVRRKPEGHGFAEGMTENGRSMSQIGG